MSNKASVKMTLEDLKLFISTKISRLLLITNVHFIDRREIDKTLYCRVFTEEGDGPGYMISSDGLTYTGISRLVGQVDDEVTKERFKMHEKEIFELFNMYFLACIEIEKQENS